MIYQTVKYVLKLKNVQEQIKWCREQMENCKDNKKYKILAELLEKLIKFEERMEFKLMSLS